VVDRYVCLVVAVTLASDPCGGVSTEFRTDVRCTYVW